jgi:MFS family permease
MRRLVSLLAVLVLVDTMLYTALTPLLPHLAHELGLSKPRAGVLVAAYAVGALVAGFLGGLAATSLGARRAVLIGLAAMGLAGLGFAFADSFWTLFTARLLQGAGSGFTWAGAFAWLLAATPRERRGEMIGATMGSASFGALLGPVVGAAAALAGRGVVFASLAALAVVLGAWALRLEPTPCETMSFSAIGRALGNTSFQWGMLVMTLGALLFGVLAVLAPLHLAAAGWGAAAIGAVFLAAAGLEALQAPFAGRLSDRRGPLLPTRIALGAGAVLTLGLASGARPLVYVPVLAVAALFFGTLFTTAFALLAEGAEEVGLPQGMAFGLMNVAWATGAVAGPAAGGAIAGATGDWIPFVIAAALCASALAALPRGSVRRVPAKASLATPTEKGRHGSAGTRPIS